MLGHMSNDAPITAADAGDSSTGHSTSTEGPADGFDSVRQHYPPILNTAQVAELLDLNPRTVLNMAGDGRLPASRLPGSRKFHFLLEDIIATLKASRVVAER